jgi:hypothetical protein
LLVPIIAVFTKFDQFKFDVEMRLVDEGCEEPSQDLVDATVQERLETEYIGAIQGQPRHVVLDGKSTVNDSVYCSNNIVRNA